LVVVGSLDLVLSSLDKPLTLLLEKLLLSLKRRCACSLLFHSRIVIFVEREGLALNRIIELLDEFLVQVLAIIDSFDHFAEVLHSHSRFLSVRVVQ